MTPNLDCYGAGIAALADLIGDFELRSPMDVHGWYRREWEAIADALGFSQELAAELAALRSVRDRVAATTQAGVAAFARWLAVQRPGVTDNQAHVQDAVLGQLITRGRERGELWRIAADPTTLSALLSTPSRLSIVSRLSHPAPIQQPYWQPRHALQIGLRRLPRSANALPELGHLRRRRTSRQPLKSPSL
ncbi:MAG TPA: hypothetical protein PKW35_23300, partial [Nannocystaceae bacterium]|nr:hypothetical protein [Nannocystaceae bacterium]